MGMILDTSLIIRAERGLLDMPQFLRSYSGAEVALSVITASELLHGCERAVDPDIRRNRTQFVEGILSRFPIIDFSLREARHHARLWAVLAAKGTTIGSHDLMIAATALSLKYSVATLNIKEFIQIPNLKVISP